MTDTKDNLREYQNMILEIFWDVVKVCKDNGITYFLTDGSCLGAIRHEGIIPWDDDIDMGIFSDDYDKFYEALNTSLGSKYTIERTFDQRRFPTHTDVI